MVRIILPRITWSGLVFGGALAVALAAVAWAGFAGPNRTTTEQVRDPDNDEWFCKKGTIACTFAKNPANPCPDFGGSQPDTVSQQKVCGWIADTCGCNEAYTEQTINLPPATVGGSAACGVPGSAGWCRGGAALNLSANEPLAGQVIQVIEANPVGLLCDPSDAPSVACSWTGGDGNFTLQFWAVSSYGDTSSMSSADWKVDAAPPSITLSVSAGTPGGGGWYRGGTITVSVSGADSVSGVASADVSIDGGAWGSSGQVSSDGIHQVAGRIRDAAGNEATASASIRYDGSPPNVSPDISGTLGRDGWYISPVTASASASDTLSGVAEQQVSVGGGGWQASPLLLAQDGSHSLRFRAVDVAGNEAVAAGPTVKVDVHPPESVFIDPPNGSETWVSGIVDLVGKSLDFTSGLLSVEISFNAGTSWGMLILRGTDWDDQWDTRQVPNGTYIVLARARDVAGHLESTAKVTLRVDNLPPFVDIPDSWPVGELAPLTVEEQDIGLAGVRVVIQRAETVLYTLEYDPVEVPDYISWDGVMPDGSSAAAGEYGVYATAWDFAGNQGSDAGMIVVPGAAIPLVGQTSARSEFPAVSNPAAESASEFDAPQPMLITRNPWLWPVFAWFGLLGGLAAAKLTDPRPRALRGLRQELIRIRRSMEE